MSVGAPKVALCHEWLTTYGGSEQVARRMREAVGTNDIYTFTARKELVDALFPGARVHVSKVGTSLSVQENWQRYLAVMPYAWRRFDLSEYDLILTSSHSCVNSIRPRPDATLISYCHTPMRYAWDWRAEIGRFPRAIRPVWPLVASAFRAADRRWAQRVNLYIANSAFVARRIQDHYGREAVVIHPPIDTSYWCPDPSVEKEDFFLVAGRLVAYKRPEVAVRAAMQLGERLVVAGDGPELEKLRSIGDENITFVQGPSTDELRDLYRRAKALVFPGIEDFGMTPVEAQACGTPVIALGHGGVLESVREGVTGVLYDDPSPSGLAAAMRTLAETSISVDDLVAHARHFDASVFDARLQELLNQVF